MKNRYGLDADYIAGKLHNIIRDVDNYTPDEMARSLLRLANVANKTVFAEAEFSGEIIAERDAILQQAKQWKMEAKTQGAIVKEIYQAITGAAGEPGDWNGAEPVKKVIAEVSRLQAVNAELLEALKELLPLAEMYNGSRQYKNAKKLILKATGEQQ